MLRDISPLSIAVRVVLSMLIGGLLGIERGRKNRPAGFRTYMLVCLGATLVMMTNQYVFQTYDVSDPVRMGAQVVSGIGFLGAGTIITTKKSQVKGITTAAGLWAAACSGLAIGIGFYEGAIACGIASLFVMSAMRRLDAAIHSHSQVIDLYVEYRTSKPFSKFMESARTLGFDITDLQITRSPVAKDKLICAVFSAKSLQRRRNHSEMLEQLSTIEGVHYIEEV